MAALPGTAIKVLIAFWWENRQLTETELEPRVGHDKSTVRKARICGIREGGPAPRAPRSGASNLDAIINEGTLVIGWVGPALFGILFAAFAWATGVFQWLWSLATWLFSGAWRGGGPVER